MNACVPARRRTRLALLLVCLCAGGARAQQPEPTPAPSDEIIRVSTELVQTDVVVFDKQGKFVDGLRAEDFDLRVDGRPQTVAFFERVRAGSLNEEAQLAAARGGRDRADGAPAAAAVRPLDRGRQIFFFVDDLHLSAASLVRTRELLLNFIDKQLGQNDQVAVVTTSGQVGFLQQPTDDQDVMRAAVQRLSFRELNARDMSSPPMNAMDALSIERNDSSVVSAFVDATLREMPAPSRPGGTGGGTSTGPNNQSARAVAENQVRARASQLIQQITSVATQTLGSLYNLLRTTSQLPGRKLVYFISDGFVINTSQGDVLDRLRRVTDAAVRSGVVVYTLDARGLSASLPGVPDVSVGRAVDPTGRLAMSAGNETSAMQEPLRVIAGDTGGRALLNTNALTNAITQALEETSVYYLLAWRPAQEEMRGGKFHRIEVEVKGRPELSVLVQRGFFTELPEEQHKRDEAKRDKDKDKRVAVANNNAAPAAGTTPAVAMPHPALLTALRSYAPRTALPTALTLNYFNTPEYGVLLASSLQVVVEPPAPGQTKRVDVIGAIYDAQGGATASFERHITVSPKPQQQAEAGAQPQPPNAPEPQRVIVTHQTKIAPGIYQARIATREVETGRTGSAAQWITIPALADGKLVLSSIFLGERPRTAEGGAGAQAPPAQALVNPDRHFARTSVLRFVLYIYNAARTGQAGAPDVALQLQIFRDDQPVITAPLRKVQTEGLTDFAVIPYAAELDLGGLPAGRYVLQATAIDRTAKTSAAQRVKFTVD